MRKIERLRIEKKKFHSHRSERQKKKSPRIIKIFSRTEKSVPLYARNFPLFIAHEFVKDWNLLFVFLFQKALFENYSRRIRKTILI